MTTTPPEGQEGPDTPPPPPPGGQTPGPGQGQPGQPQQGAPQGQYGAPQGQPGQYGAPQGQPGQYGAPQGQYGPPPGQYGQPGYGQPAAPLSDSDQRLWATLAHIGGLVLSFVAPLVIWLIFKDRGRFVEDQAKEALNFQITVAIVFVAISIITTITFGLGGILYLGLIAAVVFMILAAVAANRGEMYRYPLNIRIIK